MSRYTYTKTEQEINNVLHFHERKLDSITLPDNDRIDASIEESEALLKSIGFALPDKTAIPTTLPMGVVTLPTWDRLCIDAENTVGDQCLLEDLFTTEELRNNTDFITQLNSDYKELHRLDKYDVCISAVGGLVAALIDIMMVGIPQKTSEGMRGGILADYIRDYFDRLYPEEEMQRIASSVPSKVPYDAQDNRHTIQYVEGLSAYYHRLLSLGHDPILGFVVGVSDIMTGRMTTIDKAGKVVSQIIPEYADRTEEELFLAIAKQIIHFKSDITTSMGLPAPLMGLFNLLQFGNIGEEEQTIAEIVQGMYYEGYDFIHFCSLSIPVMVAEVIVRVGYAVKRIKEGYPIKASIPFSVNHEIHPKLGTMLFLGHSAATAINAGKVYFTKNPMAINYPQWLAFGKRFYQQAKWALIEKQKAQDLYIEEFIYSETRDVFNAIERTFSSVTSQYMVIMD